MKFTTLIPMYFNDGGEVPNDTLQTMIDELAREFGGCSDEGITRGQWIDPADATLFRDECRRITVFCDRTMLDDARAAVVRIGRQLKQQVAAGASATDVHNAFFGIGGRFGELFPTRPERDAFMQTPEYNEIFAIRVSLREQEKAAS